MGLVRGLVEVTWSDALNRAALVSSSLNSAFRERSSTRTNLDFFYFFFLSVSVFNPELLDLRRSKSDDGSRKRRGEKREGKDEKRRLTTSADRS